MTFSSLVFVCIFLPVVFVLHTLIPSIRVRNALLICASLVFYAFGEPVYVLLMICSAFLNYACALAMGERRRKGVLVLAVVVNIGILCVFKYTGFLLHTVNRLFSLSIPVPEIALPIGISFFTFQALSYVIDVYRGETAVQKSFCRVLLYISFFPQLIAGPIVKYKDIEREIGERRVCAEEAAPGFRRFVFGLAKKVLIANTMAVAADAVLGAEVQQLGAGAAWIGALAYTMQIYFDFSGYSDMAIGLGRMFGFHFRENFLYPYASDTIKEFWRRWHISLSSWFKDYVYIPLGGNRRGRVRTGINKVLVFFLTGLWHGANWTFVLWGLFHGFFSSLEEWVPIRKKLPRVLRHIYTMMIVLIGFVIFRADNVGHAFAYLGRMFTGFVFTPATLSFALQQLTPFFLVMLAAAVFFCGPFCGIRNARRIEEGQSRTGLQMLLYVVALLLLVWCLLRLSGGSYNPFIYFRF